MKTLLIEEVDDSRRELEAALRRRGHQVVDFGDANTASAALGSESFPLVVLALGASRRDSLELCRHLRAQPGGNASEILVITEQDDLTAIELGLEAGATDYLVKPFAISAFDIRVAVAEQRSARHQR
jgi:two-component system OmpR family response regulator